MKILLIYPPRRADTYMNPPTPLLYISQAVRRAGHEAEIIDIPYLLEKYPDQYSLEDGSLFDYILSKDCDILGLGGVVSTYFFYDYFVPKYRLIKKDIPIVVGGSVGIPIKEVWERYNPVDYLVEGDGEIVIQRLLNGLEEKDCMAVKNIPGLFYLENGKFQGNHPESISPIDQIPFLSYDEIDYEYYIDGLSRWIGDTNPGEGLMKSKQPRFLPLLTSRGCPYKCTFCFHFDTKLSLHSTNYVVENIKFLIKKYRVDAFYVIDDLFVINSKRTVELCDGISEANLGVSFFGSGGKPNLITPQVLESMKRANFVRFSYGIESGSQKILDTMEKRCSVEQNLNALKMTEEQKIPCFANIIFGMPGEDMQTLNDTKNLLIEADLTTKHFYSSWAVAYPGTPLFDWMKEKNLVTDIRRYLFSIGSIGSYTFNFSDLPLNKFKREVFKLKLDVDLAHYKKHGQYKDYINKLIFKILGSMVYLFPPKIRSAIISLARIFVPGLTGTGSRYKQRHIKLSEAQIERWVASLQPRLQNGGADIGLKSCADFKLAVQEDKEKEMRQLESAIKNGENILKGDLGEAQRINAELIKSF